MPKNDNDTIVENEDGTISVNLGDESITSTPRKFKGTDANPVDAETGEEIFDDVDPRFASTKGADEPAEDADDVAVDDADEPAVTEEEPEVFAEDEGTPESEDSDTVDEPIANKGQLMKRLDRERRAREELRAELRATNQQLQELRANTQQVADETKYSTDKKRFEDDIVKTRAELLAAVEAGESKKQVELQDKLTDLKTDLKVLEIQHTTAKAAAATDASSRAQSPVRGIKIQQWIRRHPRYQTDPQFAAVAKAVDSQVAAAGFSPDNDDYYTELNRRLAKFYPKEFAVKKSQPRRNSPVGTASRESAATGPSARKPVKKDSTSISVVKGVARLTPRQLQIMRDFRMDPENPNDVREFVRNNINK